MNKPRPSFLELWLVRITKVEIVNLLIEEIFVIVSFKCVEKRFDECGNPKRDFVTFPKIERFIDFKETVLDGPYIDKQIDYLVQIR